MGKLNIPSVDDIIKEAIKNVQDRYKINTLREAATSVGLSKLLNEIEEETNRLYKLYERKAIDEYIKLHYQDMKDPSEVFLKALENSLVKSITNTRKSRGGQSSQKLLAYILQYGYGIPCEASKIRISGYEVDIGVPSKEAILEGWGYALAVKRTLRERWFEDLPIFNYPHSAFVLIKPDPDFNLKKARAMVTQGLKKAYIPDELYEAFRNELEQSYSQIFKKLSDLPNDLLEFLRRNSPYRSHGNI